MTIHPTLQRNTNEAAVTVALAGWGLTRVLSYQIGAALLDGRLEVVLGDYEEVPLPIHVIHASGCHAPAKVRTFVEAAVSRLWSNPLLKSRVGT